jgi:hypothetical protein
VEILYLEVPKLGKAMLYVMILNFLSHISHAVFLSNSERKLISVWLMGLLVCGVDKAGSLPLSAQK